MRGLLEAALLLGPALASAIIVPDVEEIEEWDVKEIDVPVASHPSAFIAVNIPNQSPDDDPLVMPFRLDVFPSEEACGYGNVTVGGQVLPQIVDGDVSTGKGSVTTDTQNTVVASWSFHCIRVNGQPDSQFLKFVVETIGGKAVENVGFSALFRQTGSTEIINIETDLTLPDRIVANPMPEGLQLVDEEDYFPRLNVEQEMQDLHWMRAQMRELEYLIREKEQAIAEHTSAHFKEEIRDCDSLKCVAKAVVQKAKKVAHKALNKIHGDHGKHDGQFIQISEPLFKKPQWSKISKHGKKGNHTCGPPKHRNHTIPPLHWKKLHLSHYHPLPICHYPLRPFPHHKLYYMPAPPGGGPPPYQGHHIQMSPSSPPSPGKHDRPGYDKDDEMLPLPPHGLHSEFPANDDEMPPLPPGQHAGPGHDDHHHPPPPPNHEEEAPFFALDGPDDTGPPGPPGRHHPEGFGRPRHNGLGKAFHIVKFVVIGFLFAFLIIALHRRTCNPKRRAARQARREERHRRHAFRHAAYRHAISRFLTRISGQDSDGESDDYEEKQQALLASAEDGMSTTMTEEITEFRNAAEVVEDMVTAEEGRIQSRIQARPIPIPVSEDRPLMRDYDIGSQVGDGEELPAYEDNDGSEMSSMVADGFRYTPGSTEYSPSQSPAGSVSDILGPDTKQ